jgi:hypothetical protein
MRKSPEHVTISNQYGVESDLYRNNRSPSYDQAEFMFKSPTVTKGVKSCIPLYVLSNFFAKLHISIILKFIFCKDYTTDFILYRVNNYIFSIL